MKTQIHISFICYVIGAALTITGAYMLDPRATFIAAGAIFFYMAWDLQKE